MLPLTSCPDDCPHRADMQPSARYPNMQWPQMPMMSATNHPNDPNHHQRMMVNHQAHPGQLPMAQYQQNGIMPMHLQQLGNASVPMSRPPSPMLFHRQAATQRFDATNAGLNQFPMGVQMSYSNHAYQQFMPPFPVHETQPMPHYTHVPHRNATPGFTALSFPSPLESSAPQYTQLTTRMHQTNRVEHDNMSATPRFEYHRNAFNVSTGPEPPLLMYQNRENAQAMQHARFFRDASTQADYGCPYPNVDESFSYLSPPEGLLPMLSIAPEMAVMRLSDQGSSRSTTDDEAAGSDQAFQNHRE